MDRSWTTSQWGAQTTRQQPVSYRVRGVITTWWSQPCQWSGLDSVWRRSVSVQLDHSRRTLCVWTCCSRTGRRCTGLPTSTPNGRPGSLRGRLTLTGTCLQSKSDSDTRRARGSRTTRNCEPWCATGISPGRTVMTAQARKPARSTVPSGTRSEVPSAVPEHSFFFRLSNALVKLRGKTLDGFWYRRKVLWVDRPSAHQSGQINWTRRVAAEMSAKSGAVRPIHRPGNDFEVGGGAKVNIFNTMHRSSRHLLGNIER